MKTIYDLALLLKRHQDNTISILCDKNGFAVMLGSESAQSKHLDDALENLAEELRRASNGQESVRVPAPATATATAPTVKTTITTASARGCNNCFGAGGVYTNAHDPSGGIIFKMIPCPACQPRPATVTP